MARKKQLSKETRVQICTLRKEGYTGREIAKRLMVLNKGVHYTLKRLEGTGSYDDRKRSGRKRVTTKADNKNIIVTSKRDWRKTAPQIREEVNMTRSKPISLATVRRRFRKAGLKGCVSARNPLLHPENKKGDMSGQKHTKIGPMMTGSKFSGPTKASLNYLVQIAESMSTDKPVNVLNHHA